MLHHSERNRCVLDAPYSRMLAKVIVDLSLVAVERINPEEKNENVFVWETIVFLKCIL